jgi:mannose-6-phosphate isomerase
MQLERHFVEKPWGRTDVPAAFDAPAGKRIGEVWYETPNGGELPILIKWIFTSEKLSIQVHPNDEQAQARGLPSGKEECWVIVDAEPDAVLGIGTMRPLSAEELREASLSGKIEQLMNWKPVKRGDYFFVPAGTVHAIGAGITLVEVQQYADVTYRLYDYGRPRELHLDDGADVAMARPYDDARSGQVAGGKRLVNGPHFWLDYLDSVEALERPTKPDPMWLVPLKDGAGTCHQILSTENLPFDTKGPLLIAGIGGRNG